MEKKKFVTARSARLAMEVSQLVKTPPWGVTYYPSDSLYVLSVAINGPKDTPYEGGTFKLTIVIPERYPFEPPLVKFVTPIYHPNIDKGGRICMDLLKMPIKGKGLGWLPTIRLETLLVALQTLIGNPNPDDPLMMDIANEYKNNIDKYNQKAKQATEKYAKP